MSIPRQPKYIRLPAKIELLIIEQALKEGISQSQMMLHLICRGLHQTNYRIQDYLNEITDDSQGNEGQEK